jgi:hypothetical protein
MAIDIDTLIPLVRDGLADAPFDYIDDKLIKRDLEDAYDYVMYIVADDIAENMTRRCIIRYGTFMSYRNHIGLSDRRGNPPANCVTQLQTLLMQTYNCLSLISKFKLNPDLSLDTDDETTVVGGVVSSSMIDS